MNHRPLVLAAICLVYPVAGTAFESAESCPRDWQLTLRARQALLQDQALAPLNVGVSVRSRVATLWGPVSSPDLVQRALDRVRQVQGLAEVRSELWMQPLDDPLVDFLRQSPPQPPLRRPEAASPKAFRPQGVLMNRSDEAAPTTSQGPRPAPNASAEAVAVLPPIVLPALPAPSSVAILGQPLTADTAPDSLEQAVERLRWRDERFRHVRAEVHEGTVRLRSAGSRREDLFELAWSISRLAGVERVIVDEGLGKTSASRGH